MLKTTTEKCANTDVLLIAWGILKGYLHHPNIFMLQWLLTLPKVKKQLPQKWPADIAKLVAMVISLYILLKESMDDEQALALVKAIIIPIGLTRQMGLFRYVEEPQHSFAHLVTYQQRFKKEGPMRLNKMDILEQNDRRYVFAVRNCIFKTAFEKFGCPELLTVFCSIDNALYNLYEPDRIIFHRGGVGNRIVDGAKSCCFVCEDRNMEQANEDENYPQ